MAALAAAGLAAWLASAPGTPERRHAGHEEIPRTSPEDGAIAPGPAPSSAVAGGSGHASADPPPASAPAGSVDPCGSGEDDPPIARPSMSELLQLRVAELNDRMHALLSSPSSSEGMRAGLVAATDATRGDEALGLLARAPDRVDDGFDTYVAVAVVLTANALHAGDAQRAVRLSEIASRAAPDDALPLLLGALAHEARAEHLAARDLFVRAFAIDPEEPAVALNTAWRLEDGPDPSAALAAFDAYLAAVPDDLSMARRRARVALRASTFAHATRRTQRGVTLVAGAEISDARAEHLLTVITAGLDRGAALTGLPRRQELVAFVYPTQEEMQRATCTQGWTAAAYDGALETDADTADGERGDRALTHEAFHAAIHPMVSNVPTWLDEGLAQYAAGDEGPDHLRSYELMLREHTWIPFASMNDAFLVIDDTADAGLAYHQALAMVEWLVDRRGERGIRDAVQWLSAGGDPTRVLSEAAHTDLDGEALLAFVARHVAALRAQGHAAPR